MTLSLRLALAGLALAGSVVPAAAQTSREENWKRCGSSDLDQAISGCTAVIGAGGESIADLAIAYYNRGLAYERKGDSARAIENYDESIRLRPTYANAFHGRASANYRLGRRDLAMRDYNRALELDPAIAGAWADRCWLQTMLGKLDLALKDCDEAVRRSPTLARAPNNRGFVHLRAERLDAAIADFDAALRLNPRQAVPLYCRGIALKRKGLVAGGDADIAEAKTIRANIVEEMASVGVR